MAHVDEESAAAADPVFRAADRLCPALFPDDPTRSADLFLTVRDPSEPSGWRSFSRARIEELVERAIATLPAPVDPWPISTVVDDPLTIVVGVIVAARLQRAWVALNLRWPSDWLQERKAHVGPLCLLSPDRASQSFHWELTPAAHASSNTPLRSLTAERTVPLPPDSVGEASVPLSSIGASWVLFTSGTTGTPKAVVLAATALAASADAVTEALEVGPADSWYACMPLFHVGGLSIVLRTWRAAARLVSDRRFDERLLESAMLHHRCTLVSLVPTMLDRLLTAQWSPPASLRLSFVGGGPASSSLLQRAARAGLRPRFSYGLTEAASTVSVMRRDPLPDEPAWAGVALPGNVLTLDGVGADGVGEIQLVGPTLLTGHLQADGRVRLRGTGPWATGDFGAMGHDGLLRVVDRRTDLIVSGGENVYPAEVEQLLLEHPGMLDACVVGLPDERWGQRVVAAVVLRDGTTEADVTTWLGDRLAAYARPRALYRVSTIPRNAMGKAERRLLREQLQATVPT